MHLGITFPVLWHKRLSLQKFDINNTLCGIHSRQSNLTTGLVLQMKLRALVRMLLLIIHLTRGASCFVIIVLLFAPNILYSCLSCLWVYPPTAQVSALGFVSANRLTSFVP